MNKLNRLHISLMMLSDEFRELENKRSAVHNQIVSLVRRRVIKCVACEKGSYLRRWGFIQNQWYTPPRGHSEGDYWNDNDTKTCHIVCPECLAANFIYNHPQRAQIVSLVEDEGIAKKVIFSIIWNKYGDQELKQVHPEP